MRKFLFGLFSTAVVLFLASGCGSAPPPFEVIEAQIDNPTATVTPETTSSAYGSYQVANRSAKAPGVSDYSPLKAKFLRKGGGPLPFFEYLRRAGIPQSILPVLAPYLPVDNNYQLMDTTSLYKIERAEGLSQLRIQSMAPNFGDFGAGLKSSQCVKVHTSIGLSSSSGSVEVDLGCLQIGSGRIKIEVEGSTTGENSKAVVSVYFMDACDKEGNCIDGALRFKLGLSGVNLNSSRCVGGVPGTRCAGGDIDVDPNKVKTMILFSMYLRVYSKKTGESDEVKAGMRMYLDGSNKTLKLEVLTWVRTSEGEEGTLTLVLDVNAKSQTISFKVRGSNGTFHCEISQGKGYCSGVDNKGEKFSWTYTK